eukprot:9932575-Alexandrium_andersonii.AAC.1
MSATRPYVWKVQNFRRPAGHSLRAPTCGAAYVSRAHQIPTDLRRPTQDIPGVGTWDHKHA